MHFSVVVCFLFVSSVQGFRGLGVCLFFVAIFFAFFRVQGSGFRVQGFKGSGFRGLGLRGLGLWGFRALGV